MTSQLTQFNLNETLKNIDKDEDLAVIQDIYTNLNAKFQKKVIKKISKIVSLYICAIASPGFPAVKNLNYSLEIAKHHKIELDSEIFIAHLVFAFPFNSRGKELKKFKSVFNKIYLTLNLFEMNGQNAFDVYYEKCLEKFEKFNFYQYELEFIKEFKLKKDIQKEVQLLNESMIKPSHKHEKTKLKI